MIRPPSLVRTWDSYFPGDPALKQPPKLPADTATDEERTQFKADAEAYLTALRVCRETSDWSSLRVEGQEPTKFVMGQVDRNIWRDIIDRVQLPADNPQHIGSAVLVSLLFRLSCRSVVGWEKFERLPDPAWNNWTMAPASVTHMLDEVDMRIVAELGMEVFERLKATRPF